MPEIEVLIFADSDGSTPFLNWLDKQSPKVQDKCIAIKNKAKFLTNLEKHTYKES